MSLAAEAVTLRIGPATLLRNVSMRLDPGSILAIVGPNGAGKSSLLRTLSGEIRPTSGVVSLAGRTLRQWPIGDQARLRAVLSQASTLGFPFRVEEVVLLGRMAHQSGGDTAHDRAIAEAALAMVRCDQLAGRPYPTLSGGERQRVQLARVLAQIWPDDPAAGERYLLLDEPTSSLDLEHQEVTLLAARWLRERGLGVLMILHDLNLAASVADRILVLKRGQVVAEGDPIAVLQRSVIEDAFGVAVDLVPHPSRRAPLVVSTGPLANGTDWRFQ